MDKFDLNQKYKVTKEYISSISIISKTKVMAHIKMKERKLLMQHNTNFIMMN